MYSRSFAEIDVYFIFISNQLKKKINFSIKPISFGFISKQYFNELDFFLACKYGLCICMCGVVCVSACELKIQINKDRLCLICGMPLKRINLKWFIRKDECVWFFFQLSTHHGVYLLTQWERQKKIFRILHRFFRGVAQCLSLLWK